MEKQTADLKHKRGKDQKPLRCGSEAMIEFQEKRGWSGVLLCWRVIDKADVSPFGIVLVELITGRLPPH